MSSQLPLASGKGPSSTRIELVDPALVRVSPINPRYDTPADADSVAGLAAELKAAGQISDAHAEIGKDGVYELLAGSRRRQACILNDSKLRIRIHPDLSREKAIHIAYRGDHEAVAISFWDLAGGWAKLLTDGVVKTDTALAQLVGVDKGTMSRGLAFRKAPEDILKAFKDVRAISFSQWTELAPLIENEEAYPRLVERAGIVAGKAYTAARVASELKAAAAGKTEIKPIEVRNRHDKIVATIHPGHRGDFTIKVKSMAEHHPSYRLEFAKLVNEGFVEVLKTWFERDPR